MYLWFTKAISTARIYPERKINFNLLLTLASLKLNSKINANKKSNEKKVIINTIRLYVNSLKTVLNNSVDENSNIEIVIKELFIRK